MIKRLPEIFTLFILFVLGNQLTAYSQKSVIIHFDSNKEVSGAKFALRDISPGLPRDWTAFNFVVLELKSSTSQRFHIGFTTEHGYNELRVMSYAANGWIRLAIPLKFYTSLPGAALDLAATYNQPRYTGWINLGGKRGPLTGVDSIGIRMQAPINNPTIELRSVKLAVEDPGDLYMEKTPLVDEFGQWNLGDYEGKIKSLDQLRQEWNIEDKEEVTTSAYNYSRYGGYLQAREEATGFFRTKKINGRWWFVDPEGYLFLSLGVDCVHPGGGGNALNLNKRENMFKTLPPSGIGLNPARTNSVSFGKWNLYRRYKDDYPAKSMGMIFKRMDKWGLNTIGNWSDPEVTKLSRKPFMVQLEGVGIEDGLMGLPDVYDPSYLSKMESELKHFVDPYKDNPWLIGYFVGNEPSWLEQEERLCDLILAQNDETPIKKELQKYLHEGDTPGQRRQFIFNTFRIFLETVDTTLKKYDPGHLNLGMRFGHVPGKEVLAICKEVFDVFSFNCYDLFPPLKTMEAITENTGLPMIIGEYHFGTVDRGLAQSLWQVNSQKERGIAYRYYTERAFAYPGLIGAAYFQWSDEDFTGRMDGENYNCGFVDVTDRPYKYQVQAVMETARILYDIHTKKAVPYDKAPVKPRGHGSIPDIWNK